MYKHELLSEQLTGSTIEDTAYLNKTPEEGSYDEVFLQIRQLDTYPDLNRYLVVLYNEMVYMFWGFIFKNFISQIIYGNFWVLTCIHDKFGENFVWLKEPSHLH